MRNILAAPGWLLAYHKALALFTIDMCSKINKLDLFSPNNLSPLLVCPYRNIQTISGETECWPLSSMPVSHTEGKTIIDRQRVRPEVRRSENLGLQILAAISQG